MPLKITPMSIPEVLLIEPQVFGDHRGFFLETFHQQKYPAAGLDRTFVQDNHSHSARGILRGLHYQLKNPQGKLVYAVRGEIFDVAVDIRRGSPTYAQWVGAVLSDQNHRQLFVPEGFAHGFCVLSETADVLYKCTALYEPDDDRGILWSDPAVTIDWPISTPTLSEKDAHAPTLSQADPGELPCYR